MALTSLVHEETQYIIDRGSTKKPPFIQRLFESRKEL
jgi:hypothetical protein